MQFFHNCNFKVKENNKMVTRRTSARLTSAQLRRKNQNSVNSDSSSDEKNDANSDSSTDSNSESEAEDKPLSLGF